jgi:hypothetical protein
MMVGKLTEAQINHPVKAGEARYKAGRDVWISIPTYRSKIPDAGWAIQQNATSLAALGAWVAVGAIGLFFTARLDLMS